MDTYTPDIDMDHEHGGMDMQHGHEYTAWKCSIDVGLQNGLGYSA
jgi:hypothetical protein